MADGYWSMQPHVPHQVAMPPAKRPRAEFDIQQELVGHEMSNYLHRNDVVSIGARAVKGTKSIDASYDRYLQNGQLSSFGGREANNFGSGLDRNAGGMLGVSSFGAREANNFGSGLDRNAGGMQGFSSGDKIDRGGLGPLPPSTLSNSGNMNFGSSFPLDPMVKPYREMPPLPPDASNTLYVEGLPPDSSSREVSHIFRPFVGYREVRLVIKESKHRGGDPLLLCFVDFTNAACAATALNTLQGYRMDDQDPDSHYLRLQFARFPGPRSGRSGPTRGRR